MGRFYNFIYEQLVKSEDDLVGLLLMLSTKSIRLNLLLVSKRRKDENQLMMNVKHSLMLQLQKVNSSSIEMMLNLSCLMLLQIQPMKSWNVMNEKCLRIMREE